MAKLATTGRENSFVAGFTLGEDLNAPRLLQPENFAKPSLQEGEDDPLMRALKTNASLVQKVELLEQEKTSLRQKLELLELLEQEKTSLRQKFDASEKQLKDFDSKIELRQLFNDFRYGYGKKIDRDLMCWVRKNSSEFDTTDLNLVTSFSGMVINLAARKSNLQKEKEDIRLSLDHRRGIESQIESINRKLAYLKAKAASFKDPEMRWNKRIGEGFYAGFLVVVDANKVCHRDMSEPFLNAMSKRAARSEYKHEEVDLGDAVEAIIRCTKAHWAASS